MTHRLYVDQTAQTYTHQSYEITCGNCPGFLVAVTARTTTYEETRAFMAQISEVLAGHQKATPVAPRT